jgi:hypothetical protein
MAAAARSIWRKSITWLRVVLPPWWSLATFAGVLAILELFAHTVLRGTSHWDVDTRELALLAHSPRDVWLAAALVFYGAFRVLARHPSYRPAYAEWLARTPWHGQLALPLGPVHLMPQDGLILLAAWLISRHDSRLDFHCVAALLMLPFLFGLVVALRATGATAHAYLLAYGLAAAVCAGIPSPASTPLLIPLYCLGWHGLTISLRGLAAGVPSRLRQALRSLGMVKRSELPVTRNTIGFPLAQIGPRFDYPAISPRESLLISWLIAAWVYALSSRVPNPVDRAEIAYTLAQAGVIVAALVRVKIYCSEYRPPITLAGRLATRRWIIPGYDRVWLPLVFAAVAILPLNLLAIMGVREFEFGPLALGLGFSISLGMPPRLGDWALTGDHRIAADPFTRAEFLEI